MQEKHIKNKVEDVKPRIDYRFYSNVLNITVSGTDAFIDFMQFPPENNEAPTVRVYLSHPHLKEFYDILTNLPLLKEENQNTE